MNARVSGCLRVAEHLAGRARLDRAAAFEVDHLIRNGAREVHVVRDDDQRLAEIVERAEQRADLAHQLRIERGGRLVEQHHVGLHRQRARDGHALLLAAGELRRIELLLARQPDPFEIVARDLLGLRRASSS